MVVTAPGRAARPGAFPTLEPAPEPGELEACPFCAGREERTPPDTLRLPSGGDWRVRVVPNLFPAFAGHEVVIHSPAHLRSIAELDRDQLRLVAHAWQARARAAMDSGFRYVHALVNEGRSAGSSLPHTHSQLIWLDAPPPGVVEEGEMDGVLDGEVVVERDGLVLVCPWVSRSPYEMRIAPSARAPDAFGDPLLALALELTACAVRRVRALQPGCPVNVWLHDGPWWHVHVVPRLTVPAGIELGAGIDVNPLPATEAGARLRAV